MAGPMQRFLNDHPKAEAYLLSLQLERQALTSKIKARHWLDEIGQEDN